MKTFDKHDYRTRRQMLHAGAAGLSGLAIAPTWSSSVLGAGAGKWVRELKRRQDHFGLKLFGVTTELLKQRKSQTDHAARNETSLMLHHRPDRVDMSRLPESRADWPVGVGLGGEDPRDASAERGRQCMEASLAVMIKMFRDAGV